MDEPTNVVRVPMGRRELAGHRFQFRVHGSRLNAPVRDDWYVAAMDAVAAGHAHWFGQSELCLYGGAEIARV